MMNILFYLYRADGVLQSRKYSICFLMVTINTFSSKYTLSSMLHNIQTHFQINTSLCSFPSLNSVLQVLKKLDNHKEWRYDKSMISIHQKPHCNLLFFSQSQSSLILYDNNCKFYDNLLNYSSNKYTQQIIHI